jgi:hypothetical protein
MQIPYWSVSNKIHHISMQMETVLAKTIQLIQEYELFSAQEFFGEPQAKALLNPRTFGGK